jgi:hypothetical protein
MAFEPPSLESVQALRRLRDQAFERGEDCLGTLLAGLDLYIALGREIELLEAMRHFANEIRPAVEGTPTADDLRRLYEWDP